MPRLERLSISVALDSSEVNEYMTSFQSAALHVMVHALLPDPSIHALLTSFAFSLSLSDVEGEASRKTKPISKPLSIPLEQIPHVSTLYLTTFCLSSFSRQEVPGPGGFDKHALREMELRACENLDAGNLQKTIQSLKDVNAWESLDCLVIKQCDLLDYDTALEAVGKEKLSFSSW